MIVVKGNLQHHSGRGLFIRITVTAALSALLAANALGCTSDETPSVVAGFENIGTGVNTAGTPSASNGGATGANAASAGKGAGTAGMSRTGTAGKGTTGGTSVGGTGVGGKGVGGKGAGGANDSGGSGGSKASGGAGGSEVPAGDCEPFSFFITSLVAMQRESGSQDGFGGDFGGLTGADALCTRIAKSSLECAGNKTWKAFLSTSKENAIERIGKGPWYDRKGRLVAKTTADLLQERPASADAAIKNDLPNEDGVPNHNPGSGQVDNHDMLTGTNAEGKYIGSAAGTCSDWTNKTSGSPGLGHAWPGGPSRNWYCASGHPGVGCAPGVNVSDSGGRGGGGSSDSVGGKGGYGGIYCFALTP
jgi:hypothetical protein